MMETPLNKLGIEGHCLNLIKYTYIYTYACELGPSPTPFTKINSKWIKGQNVRPRTIKLLEDKTGQKLHDIAFGNDFLGMTPKTEITKVKRQFTGCVSCI